MYGFSPLVSDPATVRQIAELFQLSVHTERLAGVQAVGDAMAPTIRDGDMLVVEFSDRLCGDAVYVLEVGGGVAVRRVAVKPTGGCIIMCDNQRYGTHEVNRSELRILGRVVWKGGRFL